MDNNQGFTFSLRVIALPLLFVFVIWTVYWVEVTFHVDFTRFGVYPRTLSGLRGIIFSPFIHSSVPHLYNNSFPLIVLGASLFYFYREVSFKVLVYSILISGVITWCIARNAYHIGASGLIYALVSFIFFKGIFSKHFRLIALSLLVVFIYGSMMWYLFPIEERISWEGHLGGFLAGLILAFVFKRSIPEKPKYAWEAEDYNEENDPFLQQFDKDGNFIETSNDGNEENTTNVTYHFKNSAKED